MKKENIKKIFVNPVERISPQGRHKQVYAVTTSQGIMPTVSMKKSKELGTTAEFQFPPNPETGKLQTGLDVSINNYMLKDMDVQDVMEQYNLQESWRPIIEKLVKSDTISKQTWFEIKHGVEPDFYTSNLKYSITSLPSDMRKWGDEKTYLQKLKLILYPRPNMLTNETPRQELLMEMVKVLPQIANDKASSNSAYHDWYISEENETELENARKAEIVEKATYHLYKLKHEGGNYRAYQTLVCLTDKRGKSIGYGDLSAEAVSNMLTKHIAEKSDEQMDNISQFTKLIEMQNDIEGAAKFKVLYLVQQALNVNVLASRENRFVWHSKAGDPSVYDLGSNFDKVVAFFLKEYKEYNPDSELTNWYEVLMDEVGAKGVWLEKE